MCKTKVANFKFSPARTHYHAISLIVIFSGAFIVGCRSSSQTEWQTQIITDIQQSHIKGNVPKPSSFPEVLKRDLATYFKTQRKEEVSVGYQFLRNGPTQSGVSYPKYYLWVNVYHRKKRVDAGAVRVAAIDKTRFEVTDFLSKAEILRNPNLLDSVFPYPVRTIIRRLASAR